MNSLLNEESLEFLIAVRQEHYLWRFSVKEISLSLKKYGIKMANLLLHFGVYRKIDLDIYNAILLYYFYR